MIRAYRKHLNIVSKIYMNNNTAIAPTTDCSSSFASLPVDSTYRTNQTCKEQAAVTYRRYRTQRDEGNEISTRSRGRPRVGPFNHVPDAYVLQFSRLRPLNLGRMDKECPHCYLLYWIDKRQETFSLKNPS